MAKSKTYTGLLTYYTFRVITNVPNSMAVDCHKWQEGDDIPSATYRINPLYKGPHGGCSCPAWKWDCKHMKCMLEAIDKGFVDNLHNLRWSEKYGWEEFNMFGD